MSADVFLDPVTGDLPASFRFATPIELILQRARIRLETFLGEWLLDQSKGLPYLEWRRVKQPPLDEVLNLVRREIEDIPGVLRTEQPLIEIVNETVRVELTIAVPDDDSFRVRLDMFGLGFGSTETQGFGATNLTGSDPVPENTSPTVIVQLIAGTLGTS